MKIDIKNIKVNLAFSEETTCFTADIFVNGIKTAYARNDGHGGCTSYASYHKPNDDENLRQAEAFAKTLPSHFYEMGGKKLEIKSDLENIINFKVDDVINAKETAKFNKQIAKSMQSNIVIGIPNSGKVRIVGYGKHKLSDIVKTQLGYNSVSKLITSVVGELKEGEVILNTNLKELGF